jgi:hypothetical protein
MSPNIFLAPEHKVVLTEDFEEGLRIGRPAVQHAYLGLRDYTSNLIHHGFTKANVAGSGSDPLIDASSQPRRVGRSLTLGSCTYSKRLPAGLTGRGRERDD